MSVTVAAMAAATVGYLAWLQLLGAIAAMVAATVG